MEIIELFSADERDMLEELNKHCFEYLSGRIKMTPKQEELINKYIILKMMEADGNEE